MSCLNCHNVGFYLTTKMLGALVVASLEAALWEGAEVHFRQEIANEQEEGEQQAWEHEDLTLGSERVKKQGLYEKAGQGEEHGRLCLVAVEGLV